ncbi:MAG: bifunctional glutamate N-acetyltransferase/amino-acid acetyltransferase ArgJ [Actinobacteria bacterium]|nr:bifunctional glutamate N-acetyltransferase/amino-acid acetyltransferase ArgJ [Actinomycetota bacterium]
MQINDFKYEIIHEGTITSVPGVFSASCHCGIRRFKDDISVITIPGNTVCSAVFTKNKFAAAPVLVTKRQLEKNRNINAIIINSGIANACTGPEGVKNAEETISIASNHLGIDKANIIVSSTGRIGKQLPIDKIEKGISVCSNNLKSENGHLTARAILTIDKHPKEFALKFISEGKEIMLGGIAKGSVMVEPNMATTLSFIASNINIGEKLLDEMLFECVDDTFNCISTDGCQSTNDMIVVICNGVSGAEIKGRESAIYEKFKSALHMCLENLSKKVVEDGEGATKVIEINVKGAASKKEARDIGKKIANSILFKSAMYGEDVNWGRIAAAIGSADNGIEGGRVDIYLDNILIMGKGMAKDYDEDAAFALLKERHIRFYIDLNSGNDSSRILTNDITYEYIKINALYKKQK